MRWYKRGKKKLDKELRIEVLLTKVLNMDVYIKEMMQLNIAAMENIKFNHHKVVTIDTESSSCDTEEEDARNAADDCEHIECHRVACKRITPVIVDDGVDEEVALPPARSLYGMIFR